MTRDDPRLARRKISLGDVEIRVTHPADLDVDEHLVGPSLRAGTLHLPERVLLGARRMSKDEGFHC
jgi:hypothetical protein